MSMYTFFDELNGSQPSTHHKPFFAINRSDEQLLLTWLKEELSFIQQNNTERLQKVRHNLMRFKNFQYREQVYQPRDMEMKKTKYMPQMVVPLVRDVVEEKTARLMELKPAITIIPTHSDEEQDKVDAKVAKRFLNHIDYVHKTDLMFYRATLASKICGESYVFEEWNPDSGDDMPQTQMVSKKTDDGVEVQEVVKQGDIDYTLKTPLECFYEGARSFKEVNYCFKIDWIYTEEMKLDYPDKSMQIHEDGSNDYFDMNDLKFKTLVGKTMRITFFHRKTKYLPNGFRCVFTKDVVCAKGDLPYQHGELPFTRWIDSENPEQCSADSQLDYTKAMASSYNNMRNMMIKYLTLTAPKTYIDAGSVDEQQLNNDIGIVKLKPGSRQPQLVAPMPLSPHMVEYAKDQKDEFYQMSKSSSIVRGDIPKQLSAFVAIQYASEQESRRLNIDVINFSASVKDFYQKSLYIAGQFYKKDDKRTMLVLGNDDQYQADDYDPAVLAKSYTVMIQNSSGLPDSRSARTQLVVDMADKYPDMFTREQVIEMTGLAAADKFMDEASMASRAAEAENEQMMDTGQEIDPKEYENLIVHWKSHVMKIQGLGFKQKAPPQVQQAMIDHIKATEFLMFNQANRSPQFKQAIMVQCSQFPIYYMPPGTEGQQKIDVQNAMAQLAPPMPSPEPQAPPPHPNVKKDNVAVKNAVDQSQII